MRPPAAGRFIRAGSCTPPACSTWSGENIDRHHLIRRQHHGALHGILQVRARCPARSAPSAPASHPAGIADLDFPCESRNFSFSLQYFWKKWLDERRNVALSLAQRRQHDRDHVQPVIQILAEPAFLHQLRRSALVAAMMRTSTLIDLGEPSGMNSLSWITRSSLTASPARRCRSRQRRSCRGQLPRSIPFSTG